MNVVVAGGAGFIGSHLCRALITAGHRVICVDNLSTGRLMNIASLKNEDAFTFLETDISSLRLNHGDVVIHLASPASPVDYARLPLETLAANSSGTWNLLNLARDVGARFVYVSTSEVYGDPLVHPQPETYFGNVDPIGPRSCYDEGKRFGEALVTAYRGVYGVSAAIVRLFNTYGPGMRLDDGRIIPAFISAILAGDPLPIQGDGLQTRSFMYIDDLIVALQLVLSDYELDGLVMNIGNPDEVTVLYVAQLLGVITGHTTTQTSVARRGDPRQRCPDITLIERRYGWIPTVSLAAGLQRVWDDVSW